eukprot:COSAG01_NODE_395_length_17610_cov_20.238764_10_plen_364_part_00
MAAVAPLPSFFTRRSGPTPVASGAAPLAAPPPQSAASRAIENARKHLDRARVSLHLPPLGPVRSAAAANATTAPGAEDARAGRALPVPTTGTFSRDGADDDGANDRLRAQLQQAEAVQTQLSDEKAQLRAQIEQLQLQLQKAETVQSRLADEKAQLSGQNDRLQAQLQQAGDDDGGGDEDGGAQDASAAAALADERRGRAEEREAADAQRRVNEGRISELEVALATAEAAAAAAATATAGTDGDGDGAGRAGSSAEEFTPHGAVNLLTKWLRCAPSACLPHQRVAASQSASAPTRRLADLRPSPRPCDDRHCSGEGGVDLLVELVAAGADEALQGRSAAEEEEEEGHGSALETLQSAAKAVSV